MRLHFFALLLSIGALSVLTVFAAITGGPIEIVTYSLYGASLVIFYLIRTLYAHSKTKPHPTPKTLARLDHAMIFVLTAATYTPVALLLPYPGWGWSIFGLMWGFSLMATAALFFSPLRRTTLTSFFYGSVLILDLISFSTIHSFLTPSIFFWFSLGGAFYLLETLWILLKSNTTLALPFLVMGSFCHFWALLLLLK